MRSVAGTRSVVVERMMPHSPEKIWRALTESPLIEEWLMENDFQPVVEPNERLAYRWTASGEEANSSALRMTENP